MIGYTCVINLVYKKIEENKIFNEKKSPLKWKLVNSISEIVPELISD